MLDPMRRTTLLIPDDLRERLRRVAAERGVSMASLIREALDEKVRTDHPRPRSIGIGASGRIDTARRASEEHPEPPPFR